LLFVRQKKTSLTHAPAPRSQARPEDALHRDLVESGVRGRREDVLRAKAFAQVDASRAYVFHGCASVPEYGRRIGYGWTQARQYAAAGRVLAACPAAEALLLSGTMSIATLAILEPLFTEESLRPRDENGVLLAGEAILAWAATRSDRALRRYVAKRREAVRIGGPTLERTLYLSGQGAEDLDRVRTLVSRSRRRPVSTSEAAEHAFRHYVERHDLLEKPSRSRRAAPIPPRDDGGRNPRYVPAEVRRSLMAEHEDVCAIDLCENETWLENAHHRPHALGGGNERADQHRLCSLHHAMKDHGEILWVPDPGDPRGGVYRTPEGREIPLKPRAAREPSATGPPGGQVRERAPPLRASVERVRLRRALGARCPAPS
jgi:hypothetical protein